MADPDLVHRAEPRRDARHDAQRALHVRLQLRKGVVKGGVEIPQPGAGLIRHLRPGHAATVGQPERGDFALDLLRVGELEPLASGGGAAAEDHGEAVELGQQRASFRLRGMGGEDQFNRTPVDQSLHFRGGNTAGLQLRDRGFDRLTDRFCIFRPG